MRFDAPTLMRGIGPMLLLQGPAGALQFGTLEAANRALRRTKWGGAPAIRHLVSGAAGALVASCVRVPQEVLKQGVQAGLYDDFGAAVRAVWAGPMLRPAAGLGGRLFKGYTATVARDVPWNALSYLFFMTLKTYYSKFDKVHVCPATGAAADGKTHGCSHMSALHSRLATEGGTSTSFSGHLAA